MLDAVVRADMLGRGAEERKAKTAARGREERCV
jgi:hypothetical protein